MEGIIQKIQELYRLLKNETEKVESYKATLTRALEDARDLKAEQDKKTQELNARENAVSSIESIIGEKEELRLCRIATDDGIGELKTQRNAFTLHQENVKEQHAIEQAELDRIREDLKKREDELRLQAEKLDLEKDNYKVNIVKKLKNDLRL